jgi:hypothetical protein
MWTWKILLQPQKEEMGGETNQIWSGSGLVAKPNASAKTLKEWDLHVLRTDGTFLAWEKWGYWEGMLLNI